MKNGHVGPEKHEFEYRDESRILSLLNFQNKPIADSRNKNAGCSVDLFATS